MAQVCPDCGGTTEVAVHGPDGPLRERETGAWVTRTCTRCATGARYSATPPPAPVDAGWIDPTICHACAHALHPQGTPCGRLVSATGRRCGCTGYLYPTETPW